MATLPGAIPPPPRAQRGGCSRLLAYGSKPSAASPLCAIPIHFPRGSRSRSPRDDLEIMLPRFPSFIPTRYSNVRTPHFVGVFHDPIPEQIRIFPVPVIGNARAPGATPDRLDPHFSPQPLNAFPIGFDPVVALQNRRQSSASYARILCVNSIEYPPRSPQPPCSSTPTARLQGFCTALSRSISDVFFPPAQPFSQAKLSAFFCRKIQFHRQFPDLGMQLAAFTFEIPTSSPASFFPLEGFGKPFKQRFLPFRDLNRVHLILGRDLLDRFHSLQRFQRHSGFECCVVSSAFGFHFRWSFRLWVSTPVCHRFL